MEIIKDGNKILAIVIKHNYSPNQTEFYTPKEFSQQLGIIKYPKGHMIPPHYHVVNPRNIVYTQEVLFIKRGKILANLFSEELEIKCKVELVTGDLIMLASGGHSFDFIEDSELIEVKQGPYVNQLEDKVIFKQSNEKIYSSK